MRYDVITNMCTDPYAQKQKGKWNAELTRTSNNQLIVTPLKQGGTNFTRGTIYAWGIVQPTQVATITVRHTDDMLDKAFDASNNMWNNTQSGDKQLKIYNGNICTYYGFFNKQSDVALWVYNDPLVVLNVGIYSEQDWQYIQDLIACGTLQYPYFFPPLDNRGGA